MYKTNWSWSILDDVLFIFLCFMLFTTYGRQEYCKILPWSVRSKDKAILEFYQQFPCVGGDPGVLLWPICHPTYLRLGPVPFGEWPLWHGLVSYSRSSDKIRAPILICLWASLAKYILLSLWQCYGTVKIMDDIDERHP